MTPSDEVAAFAFSRCTSPLTCAKPVIDRMGIRAVGILTDNGPNNATSVQVSDLLPAGVTFVSATPSQAYDPATGLWTVGTVNVGTPQTLVIQATVDSPSRRPTPRRSRVRTSSTR